jgi:hypothetical protein
MHLGISPLASVTESAHDFFVASGGIAGALIGLLFVAISVAPERVIGEDAQEHHRVRAAAALTAFSNALVVSLFALAPGETLGGAATAVGVVGLVTVVSGILALVQVRGTQTGSAVRDGLFLVGLAAVFTLQLVNGIRLLEDPDSTGALQTICILVVVCFLVGIARAWELVGGPSLGLFSQLLHLFRPKRPPTDG